MKWALIGICLLLVASVVADTSPEESAAILSSSEESSVPKSSSEETSAATSSSEETSAAKSSSEETSAAKSSSEETSAAKSSSEETSAAKSSSEEISAAKSSSEETSAAKSSSEETSAAKSLSEETSAAKSSSEEASAAKSSSEETSAAKSSSEETSAAKSSSEEASAAKSSSEETSAAKSSSEETSAAKSSSEESAVNSSSEESKDKTSESSESNESTEESDEESEESIDGLRLAEPCDEEACQLPDCRCSSTNIPGGLNARDVPQFVLVTFDDAVNAINAMTYRSIMYDRVNTNGCPIGTTFFVNHEYTNYQVVNELYNEGFEIALHSVSHQTPQSYWAQATYEDMKLEFADQKLQMSHFANIPYDDIKGIRIPFLQMTGNSSFQVMADFDLLYDSTWPAQIDVDPGLWPYTLDYASTQDCVIPPCPTASIPGVWVLPMVAWLDLEGLPCSMVDSCFHVPDHEDEEAWFRFIVTNFERHYLGNRAPFPFYIHEWYLAIHPAVRSAFIRFLNMINSLNDVYMVNSKEVIDWVKKPIPIDEYRQKPCRELTRRQCMFNGCGPLYSDHNIWSSFWMQICTLCPRVYPWLGNPLGQ